MKSRARSRSKKKWRKKVQIKKGGTAAKSKNQKSVLKKTGPVVTNGGRTVRATIQRTAGKNKIPAKVDSGRTITRKSCSSSYQSGGSQLRMFLVSGGSEDHGSRKHGQTGRRGKRRKDSRGFLPKPR